MKILGAATAALLLAAAAGGAASAEGVFDQAEGRWLSEWQTSRGGMHTAKSTFDEYGRMASVPDGPWVTFYSADDSGQWEGFWTAKSSPQRCTTAKEGNHHWGVVRFQFNQAYDEFAGTWDFCGEGEQWEWRGKRGTW